MRPVNIFKKIAFPLSMALTAFLTFSSCRQETPPNIVLIMADDMGYECLGCNGSTEYRTPNLDRLAGQGIRFEHCFSQPLCTPSRVKIMTGKYNFRNYEDFGYLNPEETTFGNILQAAGYATCIAGKWQLNGLNRNNPGNQDTRRPHHFGFEEYCLWQLHHARSEGERFANPLITENGEDLPRNPDAYGPQIFADYICDYIERKAGEPFFVYYPMVLVHGPFVPTPDSPEWKDPSKRYVRDTTFYTDMMAYTDKIIGQIEKKLKKEGVWENTLLIFTADNGTNRQIFSDTQQGTVRGGKGLSINSGNHVPLIVHWPEKIQKPRSSSTLISFNDFLPTLCEAAGIATEKYTSDGHSFLPLLSKKKEEKIPEEIFIHYSPRWGRFKHDRWVMNPEYKLYRDGRFYHTAADPLEKSPLQELTKTERILKEKFQQILEKKAEEVPFSMNDKEFKAAN